MLTLLLLELFGQSQSEWLRGLQSPHSAFEHSPNLSVGAFCPWESSDICWNLARKCRPLGKLSRASRIAGQEPLREEEEWSARDLRPASGPGTGAGARRAWVCGVEGYNWSS
ncbi:hypothetical protein VULLAG_LOCUS14997 [Vulpes lagopus]